ncbi:MAG: hypothetical protein BGO49_24080 [Planctomycetales bacterium 71-10]|nr:MAG: hypothetical protein BGO49_24080 [Planctomycetales bacterium 71-10]
MEPVPITAELSQYVRDRIAAFAEEAPARVVTHAAEAVARYGALPVLFDWTATIALTPEGRFVMWSDEGEFEGLRPVEERAWIRAALGDAAKRYPPLAALIPPRPADAPACPHCDGSGRIPGLPENVVCLCAGLGWLDLPRARRAGLPGLLKSWACGLARGRSRREGP